MTALSAARMMTTRMGDEVLPDLFRLPVTDNVHIYKGSLVGIDSAGRARPMTVSATTAICVGRAEEDADNTVVGHSAGGISVTIRQGVFLWDNDSSTPCTNANRGSVCYAKDDATVSGDSTSRAIAGTIVDVPASGQPGYGGVFVQTHYASYSGSDATTFAGSLVTGGVVLGDLQKVGYTPGVSTGGFCDVVCAITDLAGGAISGARQVVIRALSATGGTGKNVLAAATSAVGTIISSAGANAAAGPSALLMDSGATGLFSFKVTDSTNEALFVWIEAEGCRPLVKKITISGNA